MGAGRDVAKCKNEWISASTPAFLRGVGRHNFIVRAGTKYSVTCAQDFGVEVKIDWSYTFAPHNAPS
jgi:hypothetical protein